MTKKKEKVLIIGIDSQIGEALKIYLIKKKIIVYGTTRRKEFVNQNTYFLDLKKPSLKFFENEFNSVIFCAATTNIAECEKEQARHRIINVTNTIKIIDKLVQKNSFVIYLSSNAVFNGTKQFYKNNDKTCPSTIYGKFKTEVEEYLTNKVSKKSCILRLTKVITKNTPFIEHWKKEVKLKRSIKTFKNRFLSPVNIDVVINSIYLLLKKKQTGIFQLGGRDEISYSEYAKLIFKDSPSSLKLISDEIDINLGTKNIYSSLCTNLPDHIKNLKK
jgi:dTDP-4-dehydrorhamnose reductase